jgi:hypothetical protein
MFQNAEQTSPKNPTIGFITIKSSNSRWSIQCLVNANLEYTIQILVKKTCIYGKLPFYFT